MGSNDSIAFAGMKDLGVDFAKTSTTQKHRLGARVFDADGREFVYVVAGGTIAISVPVKITVGYSCTASGNAGLIFGVAHVAIASGSYGWVQVKGEVDCHVTDAQAAGVLLDWYADANGDAVENAGVTDAVRGIQLVTEDATDIVSIYLF